MTSTLNTGKLITSRGGYAQKSVATCLNQVAPLKSGMDLLITGSGDSIVGHNEPDHEDHANLSVADAITSWPDLLASGLRLGSPAVPDGGIGRLNALMDKADAAALRVDFMAIHYHRAVADPDDAKGAVEQLYRFLKGIHERVERSILLTEWNTGANWSTAPVPSENQQKVAIAAMIKMLEDTPFVERYALYNWVEESRESQCKDGPLSPAGEV